MEAGRFFISCCLLCLLTLPGAWGWGGGADKVLLKDVQVLTLVNGQYTNGRRSAGVPQLKCVGGSAGCAFVPQTVQCYNRGWDGYDVQWECKTDMENAYRFGKVEVTCEGFDYPDDPYILRGSCGLEYTIDLTKEGQSQGGYYNNYYQGARDWYQGKQKGGSTMSTIACGAGLCIIVYAIYKTCIQPSYRTERQDQYSRRNDDYPDSGSGRPGARPPPPGFNPSFYPNSSDYAGESCSAGAGSGARQGSSGGGFWTGAATGGLLGYMFGSRNNTGYAQTGYGPRPSTSFGGFGGSSWSGAGPSSSSGFSSGSSSSGSRTASGFGGTRRR